jgi:hypothetical protein
MAVTVPAAVNPMLSMKEAPAAPVIVSVACKADGVTSLETAGRTKAEPGHNAMATAPPLGQVKLLSTAVVLVGVSATDAPLNTVHRGTLLNDPRHKFPVRTKASMNVA